MNFWTKALLAVLGLALLGLAGWNLASGGQLHRVEQHDETIFARRARAAVLARAPDPASARVLSIKADGRTHACGWIDLGAEGVQPFWAYGELPEAATGDISVFLPRPTVGTAPERAGEAFDKALVTVMCRNHRAPPAPANAAADPQVDGPLLALWGENAQDWAIIPARGMRGYFAVGRRTGGGVILSPPLPTAEAARAWTMGEGKAQADRENADGRARLQILDACLDRYRDGAARKACSSLLRATD